MTEPGIRRLQERVVYENEFVSVSDDDVAFVDGSRGRYLKVEPRGGPGAVILPVHAGTVGMVRTFRYALGDFQWALPRGFGQSADPVETAREELNAELGSTDARFRLLGYVTPDSGLLASRVAVFLADVGDTHAVPKDTREVSGWRWVPLDELWAEIAAGDIEDGFTLSALALARAVGKLG